MTDGGPSDDLGRAAVAWGYSERLRLGLESPFRLVEAASRDPRLAPDERRTVSQALLAHLLASETHQVDPAVLDGIGPTRGPAAVPGEMHLALIARAIGAADDPRAGELGVRLAYTLAATERLVDAAAPAVVASVAALVADGATARREAHALLRGDRDPIDAVRTRRARRGFYVERPTLFASGERIERDAGDISAWVLDSLRALAPEVPDTATQPRDTAHARFAGRLYDAGTRALPSAPLTVAVKRHLASVRSAVRRLDDDALARARNTEMLLAVAGLQLEDRRERRTVGRMLVAAAVAMRSQAQDALWFPGDSVRPAADVAAAIGVREIVFDADVPKSWRPYFLAQLSDGVADLRRVLPGLALQPVTVRFRMTAPADSALAMHDPRTRTLHLPVLTAGGTLTHEIAHDLDRASAVLQGHQGYRSDFVARSTARSTARERNRAAGNVAASLRALTVEVADLPRSTAAERPAEIFATQVDWFVAQALASRGISSGFLSSVQDELLTGHVVHPERLRGRSRVPLLDALRGMTTVAPFAAQPPAPGMGELLRWALTGPMDREVSRSILAGESRAWAPPPLDGTGTACEPGDDPGVALLRRAADSRARGWLRQRARWTSERDAAWTRGASAASPWSTEPFERRVARLRDHILMELAAGAPLQSGIAAHGALLAQRARCLD